MVFPESHLSPTTNSVAPKQRLHWPFAESEPLSGAYTVRPRGRYWFRDLTPFIHYYADYTGGAGVRETSRIAAGVKEVPNSVPKAKGPLF